MYFLKKNNNKTNQIKTTRAPQGGSLYARMETFYT